MSILDMTPAALLAVKRFTVHNLPMGPSDRITIFALPKPKHEYVLGFDGAFGLSTGDFDAITVADRNTTPWTEVACLQGRWGPTRTPKLLYALIKLYNDAFLVGERQGGGISVLRTLVDDFLISYLYYEKAEGRLAKPLSDRLGHATVESDVTLTELRRVIRDNPIHEVFRILDLPSLLEIEKMQFQARGVKANEQMLAGRLIVPDRQLKAGAPAKMHDDLVISKALCLKGLQCVGAYEEDKPKYLPGTWGYLDNPEELHAKQDKELRQGTNTPRRGVFNKFLHERE